MRGAVYIHSFIAFMRLELTSDRTASGCTVGRCYGVAWLVSYDCRTGSRTRHREEGRDEKYSFKRSDRASAARAAIVAGSDFGATYDSDLAYQLTYHVGLSDPPFASREAQTCQR